MVCIRTPLSMRTTIKMLATHSCVDIHHAPLLILQTYQMKTFRITYVDRSGNQKTITITAPNRNYAIDQFYDMDIGRFISIQ